MLAAGLQAQKVADKSYWFYFTDKENNGFQVDEPEDFLSQRSIDRRAWQSLPVNISDLPVTQSYLDSLQKLKLEIKHVSKWLNGVLVISDDEALIDTLYEISFIDSCQWLPFPDDQYFPPAPLSNRFDDALSVPPSFGYGLSFIQVDQVGAYYLHQKGYTGRGVYIAVMDIGFANMPTLPAFQQAYAEGRILATRNYVDRSLEIYQSAGHGTYVSSIIASTWPDSLIGTAPDATLILACTENGPTETRIEEFAWIEAAEWADSLGADIFNTSLGYSHHFNDPVYNYTYEDLDGETAYITRAAAMTSRKGILSVTSAGNEGRDPWYYINAPGDAENILTVGAVDKNGNIAGFSSHGPTYDHRIKPEVVAMGVDTYLQSSSGKLAHGNGTSFSSPIMAGAAACLWQAYPSMTASDLIRAIITSSDRSDNPDATYGYGIPNLGNAYHAITSTPKPMEPEALRVFPNPFREYLNVELSLSELGDYELTIFDIQGRKVYAAFESVPARLSVPNTVGPGIYILEIKNNRNTYRGRIIRK